METPALIKHIEKYLGRINIKTEPGWNIEVRDQKYQILMFNNKPVEGSVTYTTLGLSHYLLKQDSGPEIRQELIFSCRKQYFNSSPENLISHIAAKIIDCHQAIPDKSLITPNRDLLKGIKLNSYYCTSPRYFLQEFDACLDLDPIVIFVWLIPIYRAEAEFIATHRGEEFENLLADQDPDLLDLQRPPLQHKCIKK